MSVKPYSPGACKEGVGCAVDDLRPTGAQTGGRAQQGLQIPIFDTVSKTVVDSSWRRTPLSLESNETDGALPFLSGGRAPGGDCVWVRRLGRKALICQRCCGGSVDRSTGPRLPRAGAACPALFDQGAALPGRTAHRAPAAHRGRPGERARAVRLPESRQHALPPAGLPDGDGRDSERRTPFGARPPLTGRHLLWDARSGRHRPLESAASSTSPRAKAAGIRPAVARRYRALVFALPAGGGLVSAPQSSLVIMCGFLRMSQLGLLAPQPTAPTPEPGTPDTLTVGAAMPAEARAGTTLRFVVTLANPTAGAVRLVPCPRYNEGIYTISGRVSRWYSLNCEGVRSIAAHARVSYAMALPSPQTYRPALRSFGGRSARRTSLCTAA
jgi:hypothetical protein